VKQERTVLILGAAGQVGTQLRRVFEKDNTVIAVDRTIVDLTQPDQIRAVVQRVRPQLILNAAAYTAVDKAESEREIAIAINARAPGILAEEARQIDALLVHYSTDYVFDGSKTEPWTEDDAPNPLNVYGASKLAGEESIRQVGGRYLIFRTSWVYASSGKNFLVTMLQLARTRSEIRVVCDQSGRPTTSIELATATQRIVDGVFAGQYGPAHEWSDLYHMACTGSTNWFEFAKAIFERAEARLGARAPTVTPIPSSEYPTPAARPRNSVLSTARLHDRFGIQLASWESALDAEFDILQSAAPNPPKA
jgi:dTDP-4-dehydrorhamnose reductase